MILTIFRKVVMKKVTSLVLALIFFAAPNASAQEAQTDSIKLYAPDASQIGLNSFVGTIPIYFGSNRKILCPQVTNEQESSKLARLLAYSFFRRQLGTLGYYNLTTHGSDSGCKNCEQLRSKVLPERQVKIFDIESLCELYNLLESKQNDIAVVEDLEDKHMQAERMAASNLEKYGIYCLSNILYFPNLHDVLCVSGDNIDPIDIIKPLTSEQFEKLKEAFTDLYNHGVDTKNLQAPKQPTPLNLTTLATIKNIISDEPKQG